MSETEEALIGIVGKANLLDSPEILEAYAQDNSFTTSMQPWFVVKPSNSKEVQEIVKWAKQTKTPLVPVSSGPPHFRGDTVPTAPRAVMIDLSRMKKIIRIDRRTRIVIVEPGVTYSQLQPELAKSGLRLTTSLMPRANKSVVASVLEKEPRIVTRFQWSSLDPLRCVEVVWGDGEIMMTGEAGVQGDIEPAWANHMTQAESRGPMQTDFFKFVAAAQGSMGIVTWASLKCEVLPEIHKFFFVSSQKLEELNNFVYTLLKFRFGDEILILNNHNIASILESEADNIEALDRRLPAWTAVVGIAGRDRLPEERVDFLEKDVSDIAQRFGLQLEPTIYGVKNSDLKNALLNPSPEPYWKLNYKGGFQDIFFVTTLDKTPEFVKNLYSVADSFRIPTSDIGVYLQPIHQGVGCHCEFNLPYDPSNQKETARMREFFITASNELLKQGAFYYRPYGIWADMAFNRDAQTTMLLKKTKGIFDPNNIMNPGKLCF